MGSVLPEGWKQVCTKGHSSEHSKKCTNWICPQGRRYKEWTEVQAYFQLLYMEEDIPALECRPENPKKFPDAEEEEVTLEEATNKEMDDKNKVKEDKTKELKRKRAATTAKVSSDSEDEVEAAEVKKGRKKNKDEDDDYQPEADVKKNSDFVEAPKKSPKKTRRSVAAAKESFKCSQCKSVFLSNNDLQTHIKNSHTVKELVNTTLDETPDVPKKSDKIVPVSKKQEKKDIVKSKNANAKKIEANVSELINLDSPVKEAKNENKIKVNTAPGRTVSIVNFDEDVKEVKPSESKSTNQSNAKEDSIKSSTQKLYDTRFELFKEFCSKSAGGVDPMKATAANINKFLQNLQKEKNLGKSVLNGYKSAIIKIQSDHKTQAKVEESTSKPQADATKPTLPNKPNLTSVSTTKATITPVELKTNQKQPASSTNQSVKPNQGSAKPQEAAKLAQATAKPAQVTAKPDQITAAKTVTNVKSMTPQTKPASVQQQPRQQTPQGRQQQDKASQPIQKQTPQGQSRDSTPQGRQSLGSTQNQKTPQGQQKQATPQSQTRAGTEGTPQNRQQNQQTPQFSAHVSQSREGTPQSNPRQKTPQSTVIKQVTPQSTPRQPTPQLGARQPTPTVNSGKPAAQVQQARQQPQSGTPRAQTSQPSRVQTNTPRQQNPQVRGIQPSAQPRQATPQPRQQVSQARQATPQTRQPRPQLAGNTPQARQQQVGQVKQQQQQQAKTKASAPQQQQPQSKLPQFTELPAYLKSLVNFPCKLETNAGGGPSLYRAAGQHTGLGQDSWQELRRYCHNKLLEWWQWYEPYYTFPLQVKIRMRNQTVQKTIPSSAEFQKYLKSDESLHSFHMSECELYCLANILGVPIYQLTYNLVGVGGKPEERCRWDTLDPHHGLIHKNKYDSNKEPLYILYEDKINFCKIVQTK